MPIQCLSAVCMLGVVIVGMLVMTGAITLEQLGHAAWRGFLIIVIVLTTLCVLKGLLLPILISSLVMLKHMIWWAVIIGLAIVTALLFIRMLVSKFERWLSPQGNHSKGKP